MVETVAELPLSYLMAGKPGLKEFKELLTAGGLPELGPGPRPGVLPQGELNEDIDSLLQTTELPPAARNLIRGLVLLWHDHMEPAHEIAQGVENDDGSFLHGILHRREPDYGNAAYWFRRVGRHSCYPKIAERVAVFLESKKEPVLRKKLIPDGGWDPFSFIELCEEAVGRESTDAQTQTLREIQGIESEAFLEYLLNSRCHE